MESDDDAGELGLEIVTHFGEEAAMDELVGSGLQIIAADLSARNQTGNGDDLRLSENFLAIDVDFAQQRVDGVRSLRRCGKSARQREKQESADARSKITQHVSILTETGPATPRRRTWPNYAAGRRRSRGARRCDKR